MASLQPHRQPTVEDYPTPQPTPAPKIQTMNSTSPSPSPPLQASNPREPIQLYSPAPTYAGHQMKLFNQNDSLYSSPQSFNTEPQSPYPDPTPTPRVPASAQRVPPSTQSTIDLPPHEPGTQDCTPPPQFGFQESGPGLQQGMRYNQVNRQFAAREFDPRNGQYTASPQQQGAFTSPQYPEGYMSPTQRDRSYSPQSQPQGQHSSAPQGWPQHHQMMPYPQYGVPQPMSGITSMYHHPQFGPIPYQDLGQQHGLPQRRPAGGHRYGKVTVSGSARAIRGNVNNDIYNTKSREHEYGEAEIKEGGRLFDGDVTSREMEVFWNTPQQHTVAKPVEQ